MTRKLASFRDYDDKLFDLYSRCRYNELICHELMTSASQLEKLNQGAVFISISISLVVGTAAFGFFNSQPYNLIWAVFGAIATLLSLYALIKGAGERRFFWLGLATRFRVIAEEVEQFSLFVRRRRITERELLAEWKEFTKRLSDLLEQGGIDLREYAARHAERLRDQLAAALRQERKAGKNSKRQ